MEILIIIGSILGIGILLITIATILEKFFPKNRISKKLEGILEWIQENFPF